MMIQIAELHFDNKWDDIEKKWVYFVDAEYELYINPERVYLVELTTHDHPGFSRVRIGRDWIWVSQADARRVIDHHNLTAPSPTEIRLNDQAADDILKAALATLPRIAPEQPFGTGLMAFKAMLKAGDYVVLDTETSGLEDGEIVQIAIVERSGYVLLDTLMRPAKPIPPDATRIHGITDEMVKDASSWVAVRQDVLRLLKGRNVVIYNAVYDRKMMHRSSERWGLPRTEWKEIAAFWCAMEAFAEVFGDWNEYRQSYRWQKLSTAAAHCGVEQNEAHSALADCMTTLAVCEWMAGS